jgi:hypothetical protein
LFICFENNQRTSKLIDFKNLFNFIFNYLKKEIDGAALLLLDDLDTVQNLLEFKLGPAVKFFHVVEQLRTQVIDRFHSSPSLKTSSRLSTK